MPNLEEIKHGPAETGVEDLLLRRWSPRTFADKPVAQQDLVKIFTAASWAASSNGEEPWRYILGMKGDETYAKIFETLVEFNQGWAKSAPVLFLSVAKKTFSPQVGKPGGGANAYALHDTGAATANLCLQAVALGIHTHGMAGFDQEKARTLLAIPDDFEIGAVWAMGYLGELDAIPDYLQKMETTPRKRKPLNAFVFKAWDKRADL